MNNENSLSSSDPKLIYIMGTARSGSTILEILLGSSKNAFGAGELTYIYDDGINKNSHCSCGEVFNKCTVWAGIVDFIVEQEIDISEAIKINHKYDWHWGLFRLIPGFTDNREIGFYEAQNWSIIEKLQESMGVEYIIDSSKYAPRALRLAMSRPDHVYIICLNRNAGGLLKSFRKKNVGVQEQEPRSLFSAVVYILFTTFSVALARVILGRNCVTISYEQMCSSPLQVLDSIEGLSGLDLTVPKERISQGLEFDVGHLITGNRLRKQKNVKFDPDSQSGFGVEGFFNKTLAGVLCAYQKLLRVI